MEAEHWEVAGNPLLGILPRPFNSSICTYCLCYSFLPALLCNNEGWEYPDLHQLGSTAGAAVIPSLTEWSAEGFVKHTHTTMLHLPSDQRKFAQGIQNPWHEMTDQNWAFVQQESLVLLLESWPRTSTDRAGLAEDWYAAGECWTSAEGKKDDAVTSTYLNPIEMNSGISPERDTADSDRIILEA